MIKDWYSFRQEQVQHRRPTCTCGGILDYIYGQWWKCRECADWAMWW